MCESINYVINEIVKHTAAWRSPTIAFCQIKYQDSKSFTKECKTKFNVNNLIPLYFITKMKHCKCNVSFEAFTVSCVEWVLDMVNVLSSVRGEIFRATLDVDKRTKYRLKNSASS